MNSRIAPIVKPAKKPGVLWTALILLAGATAFVIAQPLTVGYLASQELSVTPFTLKLEGYDYAIRPGTVTHFQTKTIARRSDGAVADAGVNGLLDRGFELDTRTVSLPNGDILSIADKVSAYVKWPRPSEEQIAARKERMRHPPANCVSFSAQSIVEFGTIMGHQVVAISWQPGDEKVTIWRAPDLGCEALQVRAEVLQPDGSYKLKAETKTVSLVIGEPDPSLFDLPSGYTSAKPSELLRKEFERIGAAWSEDVQRDADRADAQYLGPQAKVRQPASTSNLHSR